MLLKIAGIGWGILCLIHIIQHQPKEGYLAMALLLLCGILIELRKQNEST